MPKARDLSGMTFGRLTAIEPTRERTNRGAIIWQCQCVCGKRIKTSIDSLTGGNTQSCGCQKVDSAIKLMTRHGLYRTPEFSAWQKMKARCHNPGDPGFRNYGGRGISVCPQWLDDFAAFFDYVGPRPSPQHSIDRYPDNDGNYEPGNVRWATSKQQRANSRDGKLARSLTMKRLWQTRWLDRRAQPCQA